MVKMKTFKRLSSIFLTTALTATMMVGCGSKTADENPKSESKEGSEVIETTTEENNVVEMELWTFVELHAKFYEDMLESWNEENPDRQLKVKFTVLPYDDMHNKLQSALLSGKGSPDMCDIEVSKFANFLKGEPQLNVLNDAIEPYKDKVVQSRLDLYSKDGNIYGVPTHVGATVAFYNKELLEEAGIDYSTIVTWDDFKAAGIKYYEATGKYLGVAETGATFTLNALLAQQGTDYTTEDGKAQIDSDEMVKALTMLKDLQDNNVIATIPGGHPDTEEAYGAFNSGDYACEIMPMWQMSRYLNYMTDLNQKIAIAPVPVFEEGMPSSVGGGGTGTVVTNTAKDAELAADFLAYAKLSEEGNVKIWEELGFDPVNTDIWTDAAVTHDENNKYVQYFTNNPFDVLNKIKDQIGLIKSVEALPTINNVLTTVTLNSIFEDGKDIKKALDEAQEQIENELQ